MRTLPASGCCWVRRRPASCPTVLWETAGTFGPEEHMSFTAVRTVPPRPSRVLLFALGHDPESIEAAAGAAADCVMIEWEDAVPFDQKGHARAVTIDALEKLDWGDKNVAVRVNALDSSATYRDLVELLESPSTGRLDTIVIPKPGVAADVYAVDVFVTQIEQAVGRAKRVAFELMVESAQAFAHLDELARSSPRVEALHFGSVDFSSSMKMRVGLGTAADDYRVKGVPGDAWHGAMVQLVAAARANGLRVLDGVHISDVADPDAEQELLAEAAKRAYVLGFDGKWAVTPAQARIISEVFTPSRAQLERARAIAAAADAAGDRVPVLDGRALDPATVRDARSLVAVGTRLGL